MKNNTHQNGFTLIELMVVIAIIGILMAYAMPAYVDYNTRSKAGECLVLSNGAKLAISERWSAINSLGAIYSNTTAFLAPASSITGNNVASVTVGANAVITCLFGGTDPALVGKSITLTPKDSGGSLTWVCDASSLLVQIRPGDC